MKNLIKAASMVVVVFASAGVFAENITKPYTFTPDTDAKAEEMNANLDLLYKKVNELLAIVRPTSSSAAEAYIRALTTPENVTISPSGSGQPGMPSKEHPPIISIWQQSLESTQAIIPPRPMDR